LRALALLASLATSLAWAGEATVIRPSAFIGGDATYFVVLDGQPLRDLETRQYVRFDVPAGRHSLSVRCPKALTLTYAETSLEAEFGAAPLFFVVRPKFDCVTLERVDEKAAAPLLANSKLRADTHTTYEAGRVLASGPVETRDTTPAPGAAPANQGDIAALTSAWVDAFNSRDAARIAALYDPQAVLFGLDAKTPVSGTAAIDAYYGQAAGDATARVALGEHRVRGYGDMVVDGGICNFFGVRDGKAELVPARYTLVYRKRGGKWLIVAHHSSRVP
jgi:uncharacterized protein (TIGR02246 family)